MAASAFAFYRGAPGRDGARPVDHAAQQHHRPGQRRRAHLELRPVRLAGADARLRLERLRRDAARAVGVGRQATRGERRDRRPRATASRRAEARTADARDRARRTASRWRPTRGCGLLDIWYDQTTADDIEASLLALGEGHRRARAQPRRTARARLQRLFTKARGKDRMKADRLAHRGRRRPVADRRRSAGRHPRRDPGRRRRPREDVQRLPGDAGREPPRTRRALPIRRLRAQGRRRRERRDPLLHGPPRRARRGRSADPPGEGGDRVGARRRTWRTSQHANHGERVVVGQRLMQATPDIFLGWTRGPGGRDFYFRQLWDMKGSVDITTLKPPGLGFYGGLCARSLARAHARSGDSVAIAAYLGHERHVRWRDRRLRRGVRRPERARPRGVRQGHRRRQDRVRSGLTPARWERRARSGRPARAGGPRAPGARSR